MRDLKLELQNSIKELDYVKVSWINKHFVIDTLEKQKSQSNSRDIREDIKIANNVQHSRGVENVR